MAAWMIRAGRGGVHAGEWLERGIVSIDWDLGGAKIDGLGRDAIRGLYEDLHRDASNQSVGAAAGQIYRFANEMAIGSTVVMYDPSTRLYHIGAIAGDCAVCLDTDQSDATYMRKIQWGKSVSRDDLSISAKNSLGSISTIFTVSDEVLDELIDASEGKVAAREDDALDEADVSAVRYATVDDGVERIKDKVLQLSWDEMELLVAGLLRAAGYRTSMTKRGGDGGRDIVASPDGLGLDYPRIIVEVKHRKGSISAPQLRSFAAALRQGDRGLYVSTGGFTKEALYEAQRAPAPICTLNLDQFVRKFLESYEHTDVETRSILPLVSIYWPA